MHIGRRVDRPQRREGAEAVLMDRMLHGPQRRRDAEGMHMDHMMDGLIKGRKWHSMVVKRRGAE